jgi:hypothetical protein
MQLEVPPPQERLAYAWAVAISCQYRSPRVAESHLESARRATYQLSAPECWDLLAAVPTLQC